MPAQLVWFKRDLRSADHAPLVAAATRGPVIALYVYEPELWGTPEFDPAHLLFVERSLRELDLDLRTIGGRLTRRVGDVVHVLDRLATACAPAGGIGAMHAHRESGNGWTYARDRQVRRWARQRDIPFIEHDQDGVCRPHPRRDGWAGRFRAAMARPPLIVPERIVDIATVLPDFDHGPGIPSDPRWPADAAPPDLGVAPPPPSLSLQPAGSAAAHALLRSFLRERVEGYQAGMSSPTTPDTSSRLSPHLAWGTLSVRTALHHQRLHRERLASRRDATAASRIHALDAFEKRLTWRGHFLQRLEDEPALEHEDLHPATRGLRDALDPELHAAWCEGRTGWPMVDACMRALHTWRWLPFRMRAMLVSTHSYLLWQPWQPAATHLARLFLDFEPGIHYSQVQMQSGTTGINELRIYDPIKQGREHDPTGAFIRRWVPELAGVPDAFLHAPFRMNAATAARAGCVIGRDYPAPPFPVSAATARARRHIEAIRAPDDARRDARSIHRRHGSRLPKHRRGWR